MRWYAEFSAGEVQGLVIDEASGRNVAVAYDSYDTPLLAAAPDMLIALEGVVAALTQPKTHPADIDAAVKWARDAIHQAKEEL